MRYIISFISQKGGVGKSTLARATAIELKKNKFSVKLIDLDIQQSTSTDWHKTRKAAKIKPFLDEIECYKTLTEALSFTSDAVDFLIIDAPARSSAGTLQIAKASDIVIQPCGASADDIKPAVLLFHELTEKGIEKNKLFIARSKIGTQSEAVEVGQFIELQAGYNILKGWILEKPYFRQAQNDGFSILEIPKRFKNMKKNAEILIQDIFDNFKNLQK
jgi:chromosome partitioning protein